METGLYKTLLKLIDGKKHKQGNKTFCKKDNTFTTITIRELEKLTGISKTTIGKVIKELRDNNLIREVINISGDSVWMLSPFFLPNTTDEYQLIFNKALYSIGSHSEAIKWAKACRVDYCLYCWNNWNSPEKIDYETGEILPRKKIEALTSDFVEDWWHYIKEYCTSNDSDYHADSDTNPLGEEIKTRRVYVNSIEFKLAA